MRKHGITKTLRRIARSQVIWYPWITLTRIQAAAELGNCSARPVSLMCLTSRQFHASIFAIVMGLFGFLFGSRGDSPQPQPQPLTIDLATFSCGQSRLGAAVSANDYFSNALRTKDTFVDERNGVELGTAREVLDSVFVTLKSFSGKFTKAGKAIDLNARTTEAQILALFGEPYWTDRSDGEVIMFYEYERGTTELQFEFTDGRALSFITLSRNGVLSTEEQRKHYKVTKPWPPK